MLVLAFCSRDHPVVHKMEGPANVGTFTLHAECTPNCIFRKLGGQKRLEQFVDGFYNIMAADKDMAKFFAARNLPHLKKRTVDFLGGMWGGDMYRGPDLFLAHTGLGLSVKTFDLMMKASEKYLKRMKADKDTTARILNDFKGMKDPLCDPSGKLAKAQNAKNLAGGDPFDDAANREAFAENQRKAAERKAKLAVFKKKRLEEEAAAKKEAAEAEKKKKEGSKAANSDGKKKSEAGKKPAKKDEGKKKDTEAAGKKDEVKQNDTEAGGTQNTTPGDKSELLLPPTKVDADASSTMESTWAGSETKDEPEPTTSMVYFDVPEALLPELQPGQRVIVRM